MSTSLDPHSQEDIHHFLKYGSVRHGEWFTGGERLPGGDHRKPLEGSGLQDAPLRPPDFPEMAEVRDKFDGCPNQFDNGTNFHQIAEWGSKTVEWHVPAVTAWAAEASAAEAAADAAEAEAEAAQATAFAAAASADAAVVKDAHASAAGAVSASLRLSAAEPRPGRPLPPLQSRAQLAASLAAATS